MALSLETSVPTDLPSCRSAKREEPTIMSPHDFWILEKIWAQSHPPLDIPGSTHCLKPDSCFCTLESFGFAEFNHGSFLGDFSPDRFTKLQKCKKRGADNHVDIGAILSMLFSPVFLSINQKK